MPPNQIKQPNNKPITSCQFLLGGKSEKIIITLNTTEEQIG